MKALIQVAYKVTKEKSVAYQSKMLMLLADRLDLSTCDYFEHAVLNQIRTKLDKQSEDLRHEKKRMLKL